MTRTKERNQQLLSKITILCFSMIIMILMIVHFSIAALAAGQGKVIAATAKIRQSADTNSEMVGSASAGDTFSIQEEVTGADGRVWYQILYEGSKLGYIRSDLMEKLNTTSTSTASGEVIEVQPVIAKVTGEQVRVRSQAATSGSIVTTVKRDVVLTVNGRSSDSEGKIWYQVNFSTDSGSFTGFVREDFISLEGEIVPVEDTPSVDSSIDDDTVVDDYTDTEPTSTVKEYETRNTDEGWMLLNNAEGVQYSIDELMTAAVENARLYSDSLSTIKSQKLIILLLVVVIIIVLLGATIIIFKLKDMLEEAQYEEKPVRKQIPKQISKQVVKNDVKPMSRPTQKPVSKPQVKQTMKPVEKPIVKASGEPKQENSKVQDTNSNFKAKNFMIDDDEFEFEFLNWDGDENM